MTTGDLTVQLLPFLKHSSQIGFNVFDVMHHGTHEKQLSNVFSWILDAGGTHNLGTLGQRLFVEQINRSGNFESPLPLGLYTVRQEVNTSDTGLGADIADIVLENNSNVIVVENYRISDGHGHEYDGYLRFGQRGGKDATVVMLCAEEDRSLLTGGWEHAAVVTYEAFLGRIAAEVENDGTYREQNPDQYAFIRQLDRKFGKEGGRMTSEGVLDFVATMCATGEAGRYGERNAEVAAERFASEVASRARERFGEGKEVLQLLKSRLRAYGDNVLRAQVNDAMGREIISEVTARYSGVYQWTINFEGGEGPGGEPVIQIKFGPSAWHANERDGDWEETIDASDADYSRLFLARADTRVVRQSRVTLQEALKGLSPTDTRLRDEILGLLGEA